MRYKWDLTSVDDAANGMVAVVVTVQQPGLVVQDILSPNEARTMAAHLTEMADNLAPASGELLPSEDETPDSGAAKVASDQ